MSLTSIPSFKGTPLTKFQLVNPHGKTHGAPSDEARHVGDLGNIDTDAQGNSKGSVSDSHVKLIGPHSVIGVSSLQSLMMQNI